MAMVDLGRIYHGYLSVTTSAREGARQASLGRTDEEVLTTALASAVPLESDRLSVAVTPSVDQRYPGTNIEVVVQYQLQILTPGMKVFLPNPFVVIGKAVMKRE